MPTASGLEEDQIIFHGLRIQGLLDNIDEEHSRHCPVCLARINEIRRDQVILNEALDDLDNYEDVTYRILLEEIYWVVRENLRYSYDLWYLYIIIFVLQCCRHLVVLLSRR